MCYTEIEQNAINAVNKAYALGKKDGIYEALSRLDMIASIIPPSITKEKLIKMIQREANSLEALVNKE